VPKVMAATMASAIFLNEFILSPCFIVFLVCPGSLLCLLSG
jgi:hypothetical protein